MVTSARSPLTSQPIKCPSPRCWAGVRIQIYCPGGANTHGEGGFFFFYCQGIRVRGNFSCSPGDTCEEEVGQEQAERESHLGTCVPGGTTSPSFPIHGGEDSALGGTEPEFPGAPLTGPPHACRPVALTRPTQQCVDTQDLSWTSTGAPTMTKSSPAAQRIARSW